MDKIVTWRAYKKVAGIDRVEKISRKAERERLDRLLARQEKKIRQAFETFIQQAESKESLSDFSAALERGDVEGALQVIDAHIVRFANVIPQVYQDVATAATANLVEGLGRAAVGLTFDQTHPRAAQQMRENKLNLIVEFTRQQRDSTRQSLTRVFSETGTGTVTTGRALRAAVQSFGLTTWQEGNVSRYRQQLENLERDALSRHLRDMRSDGVVSRAIENNEPLNKDQIDKLVDKYRKNYLTYRSEVISRTEGTRVTSLAQEEATKQVTEDLGVEQEKIIRIWNATNDNRTRDWHASMDGQKVVGLDSFFTDGQGQQLRFPGDPTAPANTTIQCRCTVSIQIK